MWHIVIYCTTRKGKQSVLWSARQKHSFTCSWSKSLDSSSIEKTNLVLGARAGRTCFPPAWKLKSSPPLEFKTCRMPKSIWNQTGTTRPSNHFNWASSPGRAGLGQSTGVTREQGTWSWSIFESAKAQACANRPGAQKAAGAGQDSRNVTEWEIPA